MNHSAMLQMRSELAVDKVKEKSREGFGGVICIDGRDGAGKTSLAHLLALETRCIVIQTDLFLIEDRKLRHSKNLKKIIEKQLKLKRMILLEGVFSQDTARSFSLDIAHRIRVIKVGNSGNCEWQGNFLRYEKDHNADTCIFLPCAEVVGSGFECRLLRNSGNHTCTHCPNNSDELNYNSTPWWHVD